MNNKTMYYIRILVSAYLLYLAYGIIKGVVTGAEGTNMIMLAAAIFFVACAIAFIVTSIKALNRIAKEEKEEAGKEEEEQPQTEQTTKDTEKKSMSIRERAKLAENVEVPEHVVDEITPQVAEQEKPDSSEESVKEEK